jgi:hypothetical protein
MGDAGAAWMGVPMKHISLVTVRDPRRIFEGIVLMRWAAHFSKLRLDTGKNPSIIQELWKDLD